MVGGFRIKQQSPRVTFGAEFRARHPRVDLRLETLDKDLEIAAEATSLAVRRGDGYWPGYASALIAPERLLAVASPAFLARNGNPANPAELPRLPLIHERRQLDDETGLTRDELGNNDTRCRFVGISNKYLPQSAMCSVAPVRGLKASSDTEAR